MSRAIARFTVYKHCFSFSNVPTIKTKEIFVSIASRPLVGAFYINGWRNAKHRFILPKLGESVRRLRADSECSEGDASSLLVTNQELPDISLSTTLLMKSRNVQGEQHLAKRIGADHLPGTWTN